jgi:uncharacterized protein YxjI
MVFRDRPSANLSPGNSSRDAHIQGGIRYRLMQNLASIPDAIIVQTDEGTVAFRIESTRRDMMDMLVIRDMVGRVRCMLPGPQSGPAATDILGGDGRSLARVTRTQISAVRDRFEVDILTGDFWIVIGDVGSREFTLDSPNGRVAEVSRRWFLLPDTFGVEVVPGQDDALVIAVAATIDRLAHDFIL